MYRQSLRSLRTARPAVRGAPCAVRATPSARYYSSNGPNGEQPGQGQPKVDLKRLALGGAVVGLVGALAAGYARSKPTRLDGVPCVEAIETFGAPWEPVHAIEQDDPKNPMRIRMATWVSNMQDHIVKTLEAVEASAPPDGEHEAQKFLRDHWIRPSGGEGSSCVLQGGRVFEKAGVNVSIVEGKLSKAMQQHMRQEHDSIPISDDPLPYFATGISIVIHPRNPHAPTCHLNYRYFETADPKDPSKTLAWWFGGGSDLTPTYFYPEDAEHFHKTLKEACDKHNPDYYPEYKKWCDKYFYLPHRKETRGVGGIFYDDLTTTSPIHKGSAPSQEDIFSFAKSASAAFLPAYVPIVLRRMNMPYTPEQREWQLIRRGRYVEFNLLYDRGTKFGLNVPGARIESILMSLPETAKWQYMCPTGDVKGSREEELIKVLKEPREWVK